MFDLEITRLGLDQAVKFFTPFFSSSSSPTPFSPSFSNLGSLYTSPPLLPFPFPQSRIDSRATGSRVVPPYPAFSHLRSRDYLPRWTFSSYATGNFILRDNTCFAIRFRPDDLLFFFLFLPFRVGNLRETYTRPDGINHEKYKICVVWLLASNSSRASSPFYPLYRAILER